MSAKAILSASVSAPPVYVEDVFSTFLYNGTGAARTITNGIDLSGKGGLTWIKKRGGANGHRFTDTARGATKSLASDSTTAEATETTGLTSFSSTGFAIGTDLYYNQNTDTFCSWTFRKAAKFFDVVTYTGTGANRTIAHNLGSVPGCIIVKSTSQADNWKVYHRSLTSNAYYILLDSAVAQSNAVDLWNSTTPTSTEFSIGSSGNINTNGATYVAYVFAHDAGGFGTAGTDNVVSCGTFSGTGFVNLGWEPQWIMIKPYNQIYNWEIYDNMRGMGQPAGASSGQALRPNTSDAESGASGISFEATGFTQTTFGASYPCIYIAIRRGPMKTPTVGTEVFNIQAATYSSLGTLTAADMVLFKGTSNNGQTAGQITDRLRGFKPFSSWTTATVSTSPFLSPSSTAAESTSNSYTGTEPIGLNVFGNKNAPLSVVYGSPNSVSASAVNCSFRRAPGFFDVVAYTGTGSSTTFSHNLGVVPELMIVKRRDSAADWDSYCVALANTEYVVLNTTAAKATGATRWDSTTPTSSVFRVGTSTTTNASAGTYIAYLFATCPSVSKVGSYTGTGTTKQIDCGFTAGARFVLIKRTDSTGSWYVWDTARGIVSADDPYLLLNSTAAEVTNTDYIDPLASGFEISSTAPAEINANGGSYIFLAVA